MALKKIQFRNPEHLAGVRLDLVLAERLPALLPPVWAKELSRSKLRKLIIAGAVYLGGYRKRIASRPVAAHEQVELYLDLDRLFSDAASKERGKKNSQFRLKAQHILFEDEDLILINKPAGLPSQPTLDEARWNCFAAVRAYLSEKSSSASNSSPVYLGMHQRLDRDTSGVMLFAKSERINFGLSQLFKERKISKNYRALVYALDPQKLSTSWVVQNFLAKNIKIASKKTKMCSVKAGGQWSKTSFRVLRQQAHLLEIEAQPKTGRMHQIRVHLSEMGLPVLGDYFYGFKMSQELMRELSSISQKVPLERYFLHAESIAFKHPLTNRDLLIQAPLPKGWNDFFR